MIGKLRGVIDSIGEDELLLDVSGVGYVLFCSASTLRALPPAGNSATVWVETHVREDHFHLYGFGDQAEREAFRILIKVSGIGAKLALAILSALSPQSLSAAIATQDTNAFRAISGIGPKMASRLVTELKGSFNLSSSISIAPLSGTRSVDHAEPPSILKDALSALIHLGYSRNDALNALNRTLSTSPDIALEDAIRKSLKELAA